MFKRLRERIAEEATKFPVGQNFGANNLRPSDSPARASDNVEDLITLSDSSAVIDPLPSSPQFSIAGDEDASFSDPNSPQKKSLNSSAGSELYSTPNNKNMMDMNSVQSPNINAPPYIPQTDIESEVEEPPTLNLDGISKEQLLSSIEILKAKLCKYKNKYAEVVKAYKVMNEDKKKLEHALTENQDKSLRRIAELREQCQLEQKAKAHLEENLRLILEEKDSRISVLETQINLLKEGQSSNPPSETESVDQSSFPCTPENASLQEKVQKLQSLLKDCKATIFSKTEQITELSREKEMLSQKIVAQSKACEEFEEKEGKIRMEYDRILEGMKSRLTDLEQQQEDSIMSMAETKKNMYEELELKERQLVKMKEEIRQLNFAVEQEKSINSDLRKQNEEKVCELLTRLETTEQVMEDGKQSLVKELSRAKAEAIALIQQENVKKVAAVEKEWSEKLIHLESNFTEKLKEKEEEILDQLHSKENEINELNAELENLKIHLESFEEEKLKSDNIVKETENAEQMLNDSTGFSKERETYEEEISKLKQEIVDLKEIKNQIQSDHLLKIDAMEEESKIKLDEQSSEFLSKLKSKEEDLRQLADSAENQEKELKATLLNLNSELSTKQKALEGLEMELLNLKSKDCEKRDEFSSRIHQLELEREQLMLEAQERVAATDLKYREELACLQKKVRDLSEQNKEIVKLKNENSKLNYQLDESLLVAAGNQSAAESELLKLRENIKKLQDKIAEKDLEFTKKEKEFSSTLSQRSALVENLKQDKESLNEKLRNLQTELIHAKDCESKIVLLQSENKNLKSELDSLAQLKQDKEELNSRISSLEDSKQELITDLELLKAENESLRTAEKELIEKMNLIEVEKASLGNKLIEAGSSKCQGCAALKCSLEKLRKESEEKLLAMDSEAENRLKLVIKEFYSQMDIKDYDCDMTVSELLEQSKCIEEKLQKKHKLDIAALRQDIFEKDYALEEMHEHYENLLKEKDAIIKELEKNSKGIHGNSNSDLQGTESSDWDDTWVVPEESCETMSPLANKEDCDKHRKEIVDLQEELEKCNTELKDLRILLRLTPPQSLHSNNNYGSSIPISEPTEFEYLKNILFNYMMGKETMTLVKVITAILRFSEEQTRLIIEREKAKHLTK